MIEFDEATHTYRDKGVLVPGVTSILSPLSDFSFVNPDVLEAASAFGTAVHLACELWDNGQLDEDALDPALVPYLAGWKQFSEDWKVEWTMVEERVTTLNIKGDTFHPEWNYTISPRVPT